MNSRSRFLFVFFIFFVGMFLLASQTHASAPVAKITGFKGEVIIQSDTKIVRVTRVGQIISDGDRIQAKQGEAQITFNDGAVMKMRPYTSTLIQEREEKKGWWIFKTKQAVRRITCFVGKLWFKSGVSKRKSYLQTPTAVCGLRGSDGDFGYDGINSYLNMYTGEAAIMGKVMKGFFADPGISAAAKSKVYQALAKAHEQAEKAKATGNPADLAKAQVAALDVVLDAAEALKDNPDETVREDAKKAADKAQELKKEAEQKLKDMGITIEETTAETTVEETVETTVPEPPPTTTTPTTTTETTTETTMCETTVSP